MVSPLFNSSNNPNSPELLAQSDIRSLLRQFHRDSTLIVAADRTPGIFALALEMVKDNSKLDLRLPKQWRSLQPKVHLVECKSDTTMIGNLRAEGRFPADWRGTLETYLFISIKEAFEAAGSEVVLGLPNRYERVWVI